MTRGLIPAGLLCAAATLLAQQGTTIQTETRVVLVDAIVTAKNGAYIRDLRQKDFRIWEDNKEQIIKSFALESSGEASQPRSLVLFFDQSTLDATDQISVLKSASRFIDAETGPNRKMAVVSYDGVLRVRQNFTDNAGRLKDALPAPSSRSEAERPGQTDRDLVAGNTNKDAGAIDDTGSRNMLQALRYLGTSLGVLPGRKIVIVFAGRIAAYSSQKSDLKEVIDSCNKSGVAVYPVEARSASAIPVPQGLIDISPSIFPDAPSIGQQRVSGPQGDAAGSGATQAESGASGQQSFAELASRTGGFVIRNVNDLLGGLQTIAGEQDQYYALTFTPPESKEGVCHTLRVKVDRGGTTVRARNSYCTSKAPDLLAGTIMGRDLEKHAAETQAGNMAASIELPYFYAAPGVARVRLAAEITPGAVKFERVKNKLHAEISLLGIASAEDGGVPARFSDNLNFDFDNEAQVDAWKAKPLHYEKEFRIAPGQYKFTLTFGQTGESQTTFGKVESPLKIDPWTGSELALSGLVLSRETHPAGDLGLSLLSGEQTPLVSGGTQVVASGSDSFTKSGSGFVYFEIYGANPASVVVRMRAVDRKTGDVKWDAGNTALPAPTNGGKRSLPFMAKLPLDTLASGAWRLEVTATDAAGKAASGSVDFAIQ